jgi:hypothetical protein
MNDSAFMLARSPSVGVWRIAAEPGSKRQWASEFF